MIVRGYNATREQFEHSRSVTDPTEVNDLRKSAELTVDFLENGLHQGILDDRTGRYTYRVEGGALVDAPPLELIGLDEEAARWKDGRRSTDARSNHDPGAPGP
eukprot:TRINITY_DN5864_c0_g1_i1.p2 TRINITY_DN5864_c0_g1~~TRINITY_DN5864_c0_g1_i1.p2  ORF type:complete len:103 (+),score=21.04 TRINITY_DN5864_c0_g1_i1:153-461(+)